MELPAPNPQGMDIFPYHLRWGWGLSIAGLLGDPAGPSSRLWFRPYPGSQPWQLLLPLVPHPISPAGPFCTMWWGPLQMGLFALQPQPLLDQAKLWGGSPEQPEVGGQGDPAPAPQQQVGRGAQCWNDRADGACLGDTQGAVMGRSVNGHLEACVLEVWPMFLASKKSWCRETVSV